MAQMPPRRRLEKNPMGAALAYAGNPHLFFRRAQIIGTNGKGSCAFFLARLLSAHGLKCGLYTSPHLVDLRERIALDGIPISEAAFGALYRDLSPVFSKFSLTHFERLTLLAAEYFRRKKAAFAVLETGLGGAGDAVSALASPTLLFTTVSLEHCDMLGGTISLIARKKAEPLRRAGRAFAGPGICPAAERILRETAAKNGVRLDFSAPAEARQTAEGTVFAHRGGKYFLPMFGAHYARNAAPALDAAACILGRRFSRKTAVRALRRARWPGRLQFYRFRNCNRLLVSCAHNDESLDADLAALRGMAAAGLIPERGLGILAGVSGRRDGAAFLRKLAELRPEVTVTKVPGHDAAFARLAGTPGVSVMEDAAGAARRLIGPRPAEKRTILVIGSVYLAGAVLGSLGGRAVPPR